MKHVVAAKVKQGREKHVKDVNSAKAKQRRAKHVKYDILAHTKQSLETLEKHVPFPAQKKENNMFFIEKHSKILWFPRKRAEARKARKTHAFQENRAEARKARKIRAFQTPKVESGT